jgi:hypothetical protein
VPAATFSYPDLCSSEPWFCSSQCESRHHSFVTEIVGYEEMKIEGSRESVYEHVVRETPSQKKPLEPVSLRREADLAQHRVDTSGRSIETRLVMHSQVSPSVGTVIYLKQPTRLAVLVHRLCAPSITTPLLAMHIFAF